ncbi:hypothetical protein Tco_0270067 [Tanacetum coccineum]
MSTSNHPIIVPSKSNIEDAFSYTHSLDYTLTSPDYFLASPGNTSPNPLDDLSMYLLASLAISPFHDDPHMKFMQAYDATNNELPIPPPRALIAPPTILPPSPISHKTHLEHHKEQIETILNYLDELPLERIENMEDKIKGLGNGRREQIRHEDEIILARVRTSTLEILIADIQKTSTSAAPAMSQAAIRKLVADSVAAALEAQAATMANTDNTTRNTRPRETPVARKCSYKEFMSCQPFNFKCTKGAVGLIRWFEQTESVFSRSNYPEDCLLVL